MRVAEKLGDGTRGHAGQFPLTALAAGFAAVLRYAARLRALKRNTAYDTGKRPACFLVCPLAKFCGLPDACRLLSRLTGG
jgi:hypothetical protein